MKIDRSLRIAATLVGFLLAYILGYVTAGGHGTAVELLLKLCAVGIVVVTVLQLLRSDGSWQRPW